MGDEISTKGVTTEKLIQDFREYLESRGYKEFNATNELIDLGDELVVTTTHAYREWTVAVRPAKGSTEQRKDLIRVRLNEDSPVQLNREKLDQVLVELGL